MMQHKWKHDKRRNIGPEESVANRCNVNSASSGRHTHNGSGIYRRITEEKLDRRQDTTRAKRKRFVWGTCKPRNGSWDARAPMREMTGGRVTAPGTVSIGTGNGNVVIEGMKAQGDEELPVSTSYDIGACVNKGM